MAVVIHMKKAPPIAKPEEKSVPTVSLDLLPQTLAAGNTTADAVDIDAADDSTSSAYGIAEKVLRVLLTIFLPVGLFMLAMGVGIAPMQDGLARTPKVVNDDYYETVMIMFGLFLTLGAVGLWSSAAGDIGLQWAGLRGGEDHLQLALLFHGHQSAWLVDDPVVSRPAAHSGRILVAVCAAGGGEEALDRQARAQCAAARVINRSRRYCTMVVLHASHMGRARR